MRASNPASTAAQHGWRGSVLLLLGLTLLVLRGLESMRSLAMFPRFWHTNDAVWWGLGLGLTACGLWLLAQTANEDAARGWRPAKSGRRFRNLILYTRAGCHLCEEARELLAQHARWLPDITEVDIDHDPRLQERFNTCVPVVSFDGKVRFRGKVSLVLLRRLIEATPAAEL
jgi:glutaredoxin